MNTVIYTRTKRNVSKIWDKDTYKTIVGATRDEAKLNNADVAVFFDDYPYLLGKDKYFTHLKKVLIPMRPIPMLYLFLLGGRYIHRGLLCNKQVIIDEKITGKKQKFLSFDVMPKKNRMTQRDFYPADWSSMKMLQEIDKLGLSYVLMRWPNKVINNEPMNDLDILIADEDAPKLRRFLKNYIGTKPIDIHTVHGGEPGRGDHMAYFPPHIAEKVLKDRVKMSKNGGAVPCMQDQFNTLAYHAVINKGPKSGLSENHEDSRAQTSKMYKELNRLKTELKLDTPLTLNGLLNYIIHIDWLPPMDMIVKKSHNNKWLIKAMDINHDLTAGLKGSYFLFILRDVVNEWGIIEEFENILKEHKFRILHSKALTAEQKKRASSSIRGGNWSSGPWKKSGGYPCHIILIEDPHPEQPSKKQRKEMPGILNARIFLKRTWRRLFNERRPVEQRANFAHTSDNNHETIEYLEIIAPELIKKLK